MCVGPIRVFIPGIEFPSPINQDVVVFIGFDKIVIDKDRPYTSVPNRYDFYFVTLNSLPEQTKLSFWFPFPSVPMPMHVKIHDLSEYSLYKKWHSQSMRRALGLRDPEDVRSYNYDESAIREVLGRGKDQQSVDEIVLDYLEEFNQADFCLTENDLAVEVVPLLEDSPYHNQQQHFVFTLKKAVEANTWFHIGFFADEIAATPLPDDTYDGEALIHYYDTSMDLVEFPWVDHPMRGAPIVPCLFQHLFMFFPKRATLEPELLPSNGDLLYWRANPELELPEGIHVADWRELAIFNGQHLTQQRDFFIHWNLHELRQEKLLVDELANDERDLVLEAASIFQSPSREYTLSKREMSVALLKSKNNKLNSDIATELGISTRGVEEHLHNIYGKLGFRDVSKTRKVVLLRAFVQLIGN